MNCYYNEIKCPRCNETILYGAPDYGLDDPQRKGVIENVCVGMKIPCPYCERKTVLVVKDIIMHIHIKPKYIKHGNNIDYVIIEYCIEVINEA